LQLQKREKTLPSYRFATGAQDAISLDSGSSIPAQSTGKAREYFARPASLARFILLR
jgi:hypothetical protein